MLTSQTFTVENIFKAVNIIHHFNSSTLPWAAKKTKGIKIEKRYDQFLYIPFIRKKTCVEGREKEAQYSACQSTKCPMKPV